MTRDAINPSPSTPWEDEASLDSTSKRTVIGKPPNNHWMHSARPPLFDLTRPAPPNYPAPSKSSSISLKTTTTPVVISPRLTALVIIDMQNFFLSTALGRDPDSAGNMAKAKLLENAIPAARAAGIRIVWLNWGLTDEDIDEMPPGTRRAFGFEASLNNDAVIDAHGVNEAAAKQVLHDSTHQADETTTTASLAKVEMSQLTENGKPKRLYRGLGSEIGPVELSDGTTVDGGRLLMRDTWNASLPSSLLTAYKAGADLARPNDVWIHKNRMSGLWEENGLATQFLKEEGIRTLIFSGVNTDQVSSPLPIQVLSTSLKSF